MSAKFELNEEGKNIEAYLPEANCKRCSHFAICSIWRTVAQVEQNQLPIKLEDFFKVIPRICPQYEVKQVVEQ